MAKNIPERRALGAERFAGTKSPRGTCDGVHATLEQTRACLLSSPSFHFPPCAASPCARRVLLSPTQQRFSPPKPGARREPRRNAGSPSAKGRLSPQHHHRAEPKGSHLRAAAGQQRPGAATHRLGAGPWPCSVAPAGSSWSHTLPLSFPPLVLLPASGWEPHPLFLHPSSEQLPTTSGQMPQPRYVPGAALQVTHETKMVAEQLLGPLLTAAEGAFGVTTAAWEGKDTNKSWFSRTCQKRRFSVCFSLFLLP